MFFVHLQATEAEFQSGQCTQVPILQKIHPALPQSLEHAILVLLHLEWCFDNTGCKWDHFMFVQLEWHHWKCKSGWHKPEVFEMTMGLNMEVSEEVACCTTGSGGASDDTVSHPWQPIASKTEGFALVPGPTLLIFVTDRRDHLRITTTQPLRHTASSRVPTTQLWHLSSTSTSRNLRLTLPSLAKSVRVILP